MKQAVIPRCPYAVERCAAEEPELEEDVAIGSMLMAALFFGECLKRRRVTR